MEFLKVCFLILSAKYEPWKSTEKGARRTWLEAIEANSNYSYFFYYGIPLKIFPKTVNRLLYRFPRRGIWNSSHKARKGTYFSDAHDIRVDIPERWDTMACKFISTASLLLKTIEFDYLIKVNTTTYVNTAALEKYLRTKRDYFGVRNKDKAFAAGWAVGYSRKSLQELVEIVNDSSKYKLFGFDDEVLGKFMTINGYLLEDVNSLILLEETKIDAQDKIFIRIKSQSDRSIQDSKRFDEVHQVIRGNS